MAAYNEQINWDNSLLGQWVRKHLMTSNPNFAAPSYTGPDVLRQNPSNSGLPAITLGGDRKTPQMAQPESGTPYPQVSTPDPAQMALAQKLLMNDALRNARNVPQQATMVQPESGTAYPQYQPPVPRSMPMGQPESGYAYPQYQAPAQAVQPAQMAAMAATRPQEIKYANSPEAAAVKTDKSKYYWLDRGDGRPLTPYLSKDGSKPEIPGATAFEDPNYKPFFGLFG